MPSWPGNYGNLRKSDSHSLALSAFHPLANSPTRPRSSLDYSRVLTRTIPSLPANPSNPATPRSTRRQPASPSCSWRHRTQESWIVPISGYGGEALTPKRSSWFQYQPHTAVTCSLPFLFKILSASPCIFPPAIVLGAGIDHSTPTAEAVCCPFYRLPDNNGAKIIDLPDNSLPFREIRATPLSGSSSGNIKEAPPLHVL